MNEYGCVSFGFYFGTTTATKRAHLAVSFGLFDPAAGFPTVTITRGISIMGGMAHSIMGG